LPPIEAENGAAEDQAAEDGSTGDERTESGRASKARIEVVRSLDETAWKIQGYDLEPNTEFEIRLDSKQCKRAQSSDTGLLDDDITECVEHRSTSAPALKLLQAGKIVAQTTMPRVGPPTP
jgi:hypothetical protein